MTGTLINAAAIVVGSLIGLLIKSRLGQRYIRIVFQAIGLFTLFLGISMSLKTDHLLLLVFSLVLGALTGEALKIDKAIEKVSDRLKKRLKTKNDHFSEGLLTSFLLFCMGAMTILGAIDEGIGNEPNLLLAKSVMDGFSSVALASALGVGVLFSVIPLILYQGGITLFAAYFQDYATEIYINELTAVGGILLLGLGLSILDIKKIKITNMIPALIYILVLVYFFG